MGYGGVRVGPVWKRWSSEKTVGGDATASNWSLAMSSIGPGAGPGGEGEEGEGGWRVDTSQERHGISRGGGVH